MPHRRGRHRRHRWTSQAAELRRSLGAAPTCQVANTGNALVLTMPQDILFATDSASLRPDLQGDLRAMARKPDALSATAGS
ncbi:MAG: hypothetical protein U5N10_00565 [Gemmobacter sp.]|nr:hypothetical protein [Gemmobacter sp.]